MIFNSFDFLVFLPATWLLYWALNRNLRAQNLLVVVASYVFYGWWDWRFLILIAFTSTWSYVVGLVELRRWEAKPSRALLTMFSQSIGNSRYLPGAFISAKPQAKMMRLWREEILRRVELYRKFSILFNRAVHRDQWRKCRAWHYFLNNIINPLPDKLTADEFRGLDMAQTHVLLHNARKWPEGMIEYYNYRDYYFTPGKPEPELATAGVIMLQNSWTDERFRAMTEDVFLRQDIRLAAMLRELLA